LLAPPSTTIDTNRPAYGGTCYSDINIGSTITVTQYNSVDVSGTVSFAFPTSAQAYAHPIDGFMEKAVSTVSDERHPFPVIPRNFDTYFLVLGSFCTLSNIVVTNIDGVVNRGIPTPIPTLRWCCSWHSNRFGSRRRGSMCRSLPSPPTPEEGRRCP
jgi:hypothetical protein